MYFDDDALLPENQDELIITVAPYGPEWSPGDFPEDIAVTMDEQVQKAVDCYNAGATVLHIHVREADGKGSKRLSMFNELIARLRDRVPKMVLQVGGSISFSPEGEGDQAKWLGYDTRHLLADLTPKPDQVTIAINTVQMNITELMTADDVAGTQFENPAVCKAWADMVVDATPTFYLEHLKRLREKGIQAYFMLANTPQLETVERLIRRGLYMGPLNHCYVAIGGGASGPDPFAMMDYVRRSPQGGVLQLETHHAQRPADDGHGDRDGTARARRDRGQHLAPQGRAVHLGAAGRADGAHGPRARPRRRDRRRCAADPQDRHLVRQRGRDARGPRHDAEPQARPEGLPCPLGAQRAPSVIGVGRGGPPGRVAAGRCARPARAELPGRRPGARVERAA